MIQICQLRLPLVPQPGLLPEVISLKPDAAAPYIKGLMKPSEVRLLERRTSFKRATIPATV